MFEDEAFINVLLPDVWKLFISIDFMSFVLEKSTYLSSVIYPFYT